MNWNKDTDFEVIFTDDAKEQAQNIIDYLFFELNNEQAAYNVEQDMKQTTRLLSHIAGSLKLCESPHLRDLGYRTIHLKRHNYFMLYRIQDGVVYNLSRSFSKLYPRYALQSIQFAKLFSRM